jgi:NitT/TauT family transport system substrate-binding protein
MGRWSRIPILCAFALMVSFHADAADTVKLRMSWTPAAYDLPVYWAKNSGWFADEGIDLVIEDGNGSATTINLMAAGSYDVGLASCGATAIARDKAGVPLKCISNVVRQTTIGLFVPKDSGIKTLKDAQAKGEFRIGFTQSSFEAPFMNAFLKAGGVDPSKFRLVNSDFQARAALYINGQVDGVIAAIPQYDSIFAQKRPSNYIAWSDLGLIIPDYGVIVRDERLAKNDPAVARFVKAFTRGWQYLLQNPDKAGEGIAAMVKMRPDAKLDPDLLKAQWEAYRPFLLTDKTKDPKTVAGWQAPEDWERAIQLMIDAGLVKPGAKATDFYTNKYLE